MTLQNIDDVNIAGLPVPQLKGYGLLYNAYAYRHADFAPPGYKVPTVQELEILRSTILLSTSIMSQRAYPTNVTGWNPTGGTDTYNFSLLPAGYRASYFVYDKTYAIIASTSVLGISSSIYSLACTYSSMRMYTAVLRDGLSVRLLRTNNIGWIEGDTVTDYDHNVYDTVKIGDQIWTVSNYKCTKLNEGTSITNVTDNTLWSNGVIPQYCSYNNAPIIEE